MKKPRPVEERGFSGLVLLVGIEPTTYALPRRCATTTLQQLEPSADLNSKLGRRYSAGRPLLEERS